MDAKMQDSPPDHHPDHQDSAPIPVEIKLHTQSRQLELCYPDGTTYRLSHEFLRVFTPSAEARGHGPGQEVLQTGKAEVSIERLEMVGHYALRPVFSDGHDSGLYTWELLHNLCLHQEALWAEYLRLLEAKGASRTAPSACPPAASSNKSCGTATGGCASCH